MNAFQYFNRPIRYGPCPRCRKPTTIGFAGETERPTFCIACIARDIATALAARRDIGPCAACRQDCVRYGDNGSPLCPGCQPSSADSGRDA